MLVAVVVVLAMSVAGCGTEGASSGGDRQGSHRHSSATPSPTVRRTAHRPKPLPPRRSPATQVPEIRGTPAPGGRKVVALTFDDGPWRDTPAVLSVLRRERVLATFFEIGRQVAATPGVSRELTDAGMSVQVHTWDHRNLTWMSNARIDAEVRRTANAIHRATGTTPRCVRPPDGAVDRRVLRRLARDRYVPVTWDVDTRDWARPGTSTIVRRAVAGARPGAIIIMHDGGGDRRQTVAALPKIIAKLRAKGYSFVPLCQ